MPIEPVAADPEALTGKRALRRVMPERNEPSWFRPGDASPEPSEPRRGRPDTLEEIVRDQLRCLASIDDGVGQISDTLQKRNLTDNTIVIFTSDHGFLHGEFGQIQGKRWPYDPCLRVPFIIRYPGVTKSSATVTQTAASIDVVPTLLELTGVKWHTDFHGDSFVSLLEDPEAAGRESLMIEYFVERVAPRCPRYFAVRTDDWKYIHYPELKGMDELYHLAEDPQERINRIDEADAQDVLAELKQELRGLSAQTENPFAILED